MLILTLFFSSEVQVQLPVQKKKQKTIASTHVILTNASEGGN